MNSSRVLWTRLFFRTVLQQTSHRHFDAAFRSLSVQPAKVQSVCAERFPANPASSQQSADGSKFFRAGFLAPFEGDAFGRADHDTGISQAIYRCAAIRFTTTTDGVFNHEYPITLNQQIHGRLQHADMCFNADNDHLFTTFSSRNGVEGRVQGLKFFSCFLEIPLIQLNSQLLVQLIK